MAQDLFSQLNKKEGAAPVSPFIKRQARRSDRPEVILEMGLSMLLSMFAQIENGTIKVRNVAEYEKVGKISMMAIDAKTALIDLEQKMARDRAFVVGYLRNCTLDDLELLRLELQGDVVDTVVEGSDVSST